MRVPWEWTRVGRVNFLLAEVERIAHFLELRWIPHQTSRLQRDMGSPFSNSDQISDYSE